MRSKNWKNWGQKNWGQIPILHGLRGRGWTPSQVPGDREGDGPRIGCGLGSGGDALREML